MLLILDNFVLIVVYIFKFTNFVLLCITVYTLFCCICAIFSRFFLVYLYHLYQICVHAALGEFCLDSCKHFQIY